MCDGCADLRFDIVANDGEITLGETITLIFLTGDKDRDAIDEGNASFEDLLDIPLGGHLAADGQVVDDDVGLGLSQDIGDVGGRSGRLLDHL